MGPAARDVIGEGVGEQGGETVHAGHARHGARFGRERVHHGVQHGRCAERRAGGQQDLHVEIDREGVELGALQPLHHGRHQPVQRHAFRPRLDGGRGDFGDAADAVIGGHDDGDRGGVAQRVQRVEETTDRAVHAQHLVVHLPRVGAEVVADDVGGRERDREQVSLRAGPQPHRLHPV